MYQKLKKFFIPLYTILTKLKHNPMKKTYEFEVIQDSCPSSPREWDNISTMICFHKRYDLGDKHHYKESYFNSWDELKTKIESEYKVMLIKPLYLYDHSGITISTSPFGCNFDSGQVGWIFIDEKQLQSITGDASGHNETNLDEIIEGEIEAYDQYIRGEVYGYRIFEVELCDKGHEHKTEIDSCWGYYGEESCEEEAQSLVKHYQTKLEVC